MDKPPSEANDLNRQQLREELRAQKSVENYIEKTKKSRTIKAWITPWSRMHTMPVFKRIWLYLAIMGVYTILAHYVIDKNTTVQLVKDAVSIGGANLILGLLLVFRTNSAYERWSEGRRLWGQLVNESRSVSLKVSRCLNVPAKEKDDFGELVVSFAFALKHHLRDSVPTIDLPGIKPSDDLLTAHVPVHVTDTLYQTLFDWYQKGFIDSIILVNLDRHLSAFMDVCGACERIRSTPLALSYRAFIRQGIALNLLALPLYSASALPLAWSVPLTMVASYFLIGLELIAEEIEDPFGHDSDDLPIDTICERIALTVHEIMRREPLNTPPKEVLNFTGSFPTPKINTL